MTAPAREYRFVKIGVLRFISNGCKYVTLERSRYRHRLHP